MDGKEKWVRYQMDGKEKVRKIADGWKGKSEKDSRWIERRVKGIVSV